MNRREVIGTMAGSVVAGGTALAKAPAPSSLAALARRSGRRFGTALGLAPFGRGDRPADPAYLALVAGQCDLLVPENELKWQATRPSADRFDFRGADRIAAFAQAHAMALRGHTLFWFPQKWFPAWLDRFDFGPSPATTAIRLLEDHVRTVCARYGSRIASYDVVNEAVDPATGRLRETVVTRAVGGGIETVDLLFRAARRAAPHAELVYNDYMSWEATPDDIRHRRGVLDLLAELRRRGTPVDTLGVQSHIRLLDGAPVARQVAALAGPWRAFLDEAVAMGFRLKITEFDVNDHAAPADVAARDRVVADYARAYLDEMLGYPALGDILCWGLADRYSWLDGFDPRRDGQGKRGTPYDRDLAAKPLRGAIAAALRGATKARRVSAP
ncbi:endo-1,4-beta-xylanase [Sphingomonas sp. ASV193]|uniref:endo-1,4-beta-xylanase n=1 Tax=Sphingomonas sp. ASV193 TaxID=3144405 RepID=UPI0032E916BB